MAVLSSRDNPTVRHLRELAQSARAVRESGQTLLLGAHLIGCALAVRVPVRQWIVSAEQSLDAEAAALKARCNAPTLELSVGLYRELTQQATCGLAALIDIPKTSARVGKHDLVALDAVQDAGNVGTILRTAAAAGVGEVWLGHGCAGAWSPKVLRAGQGAQFALVIREQVDLGAELPSCAQPVLGAVAAHGEPLYAQDLRQAVAWVFGSEGEGISPAVEAHVTRRVTIPLARDVESLNVGAAAAICLFEALRQRIGG